MTMARNAPGTSSLLPLSAIALTGLVLRVVQPGLAGFGFDEGLLATYATLVSHASVHPVVGIQTSFGFHNPPWAVYFFAPLFALTTDPRAATVLLALLGTAAIPMVFRCGRLLGGTMCGLIAAGLLALCPNAVEHSRRLWGHDTVIFFSALATWLAFEAHTRRDWRWLAGSFAAAALGQTFHLSAAMAWLPGLAVLAGGAAGARWKPLGAGAAALAVLYAPWLWREVSEGWPDIRAAADVIREGRPREDLGLAVHPLGAWVAVLADSWNHDMLGARRPWMVSPAAAVGSAMVSAAGVVLLALGIARLVRGCRRGLHGEGTLALALMLPLAGTAVAFGLLLRASVPPYMLPALVPAVLAAAWAISEGTAGTRETKATAAGVGATSGPEDAMERQPAPDASAGKPSASAAGGEPPGRTVCPVPACACSVRVPDTVVALVLAGYALGALLLVTEVRADLATGGEGSPTLGAKMVAVELISGTAGERPFAVYQNARHPDSGVDHWLDFLLHHYGQSDRVRGTVGEDILFGFVVVDRPDRIPPAAASFLRGRASLHIHWARIDLYVLEEEALEEWEAMMRSGGLPEAIGG